MRSAIVRGVGGGILAALLVLAIGLFQRVIANPGQAQLPATSAGTGIGQLTPHAPAGYVGSQACASCHATTLADWQGSDHARAMAVATPASVLGDFSDVTIRHLGETARFRREGERFLVETQGKDGKPATFAISHSFGWEPLQQYLVTFPDGRLQALPWAWDPGPPARAASAGSTSMATR